MAVLSVSGSQIALLAPFHPDLSTIAHAHQGRFRGKSIGWVFDRKNEDKLRRVCQGLWGVDGSPEAMADTVAIQIETNETLSPGRRWMGCGDIWFRGRQIVVTLRDRHITRPGRGVKFLKGAPSIHRGRLDYVETYLENGTVFTLKDVPRMALPTYAAALEQHGTMTVL